MVGFGLRVWGIVCSVGVVIALWQAPALAVPLDKDGDIKLGVRTYVNARIGTENTHQGALIAVPGSSGPNPPLTSQASSATWPKSNAGHLRQNRFFVEAELKHSLNRMLRQGVGPLSLLNDLPFKVSALGYGITFRGEADGLYDWGPREYRTAQEFKELAAAVPPNANVGGSVWLSHVGDPELLYGQAPHLVDRQRQRLRDLGVHRERLFQAYLDMNIEDLFIRFGRQILSWGETDGFRLMDNINPLDSSFGGFLIPLDERRVPLDMLRGQYYFGSLGPLSEIFLEGYIAIDNKVGFIPGTPEGSPWTLPGLGAPSINSRSFRDAPARNFSDARGGGRLVFNALDATFSIAHYYTYFDTPGLEVTTRPEFSKAAGRGDYKVPFVVGFDDGLPCGKIDPVTTLPTSEPDYSRTNCGAPVRVYQTAPKVQVSGITTTFALPSLYSIVRSELAYFKGEPAFTQGQLDPFTFNFGQYLGFNPQLNDGKATSTGGTRRRDAIAFVLGIDQNRWIRWLNPYQTFFISTQFFYKHIKNAAPGGPIFLERTVGTNTVRYPNPNREVLPPLLGVHTFNFRGSEFRNLQNIHITQPADYFLHTLFITTALRSGTVLPGMTFFYDWGGGLVYQPSITFQHDPFRFAIDYSIIDSHIYKGGSGVSLLKDRDNVQFRFEYVI